MERVALINTPSLRKRAVSRGMAGGLGFDGAETLVLPPLDLALMASTLRAAGFAVDLIDADPLGLDDDQVYERLHGKAHAAIVASVSLPTLDADAAFLAGLRARHPEAQVFAKTLVRESRVLEELLRKSGAHLVIHGEAELARPPAKMRELRHGEPLLPLLVMHDGLVARLDADQDADASRGRHLLEERVAEAVDARLAHPLEPPAGLADQLAEARRPLLVEREGGVAEVDLPDAVALDHVAELREDPLRRLRPPSLPLDERVRAVVAARIGAAPARL